MIYITYGLGAMILPIGSILICLATGDKISTIPMSLPFLDTQTTDGFMAMLLLQTVILLAAGTASASSDALLLLSFVNISMLSEIMVGQMVELELRIALDPKCTETEIKRQFLNIIWMHRKHNE